VIDSAPARRGHFRLESGMHTDVWLDLDALFADPKRIAPKVEALGARLRGYDYDAICGAMSGGGFLAQLLAHALGSQFWFTLRSVQGEAVIYRLPPALRKRASGARVVIVDDAMSAGSAMISTYDEVQQQGARVVAVAAFAILGSVGARFFTERQIPIEALSREDFNLWQPSACGMCAAGVPLETVP
jgi:orotate phosphoribosyltransferase